MVDQVDTSSLRLMWSQAPWDQVVCGFPVLQITSLEVLGPNAGEDMHIFGSERDRLGAGLVSCRLSHERMVESMLLEDQGFRFIEMLYAPEKELSAIYIDEKFSPLRVSLAREDDLPQLMDIARTSFHNERFKIDPRLNPNISDQRYENWVASSLRHPAQELYVVCDGQRRIAFFVTELLGEGTCYWHLNAVAPDAQGQGYGRRVWSAMMNHASESALNGCAPASSHATTGC